MEKMLTLETNAFEPRKKEIFAYDAEIIKHHQALHNGSLEMTGWVNYPMDSREDEWQRIAATAKEIREKYTALVVVGIGGSYLGTRSCYELLVNQRNGVKLFFAGWNLGGYYHQRLLKKLENYDVALCVVSKSGTTLETSLAFDLLKSYLKDRYGKNYTNRIYAVTDSTHGALRAEAEAHGYHTFALDGNIGGRYSVLTAVGLLPLAAAGIDIFALLNGAKKAFQDFYCEDIQQNLCYQYAAYRNVLFKEGKTTEFFSFAAPEMFRFGYWLKQLFAESEGKNGVGIYPSALSYSTDLHSVGQYLEEGNPIFFETMLCLKNYAHDIAAEGHEKTYNDHIKAVTEAVYRVRNARNTPIIRLTLEALDEEHVGYIIYFFEKACAMSCLLMGVNPFDQPGVEAYKKEMRTLLQSEK